MRKGIRLSIAMVIIPQLCGIVMSQQVVRLTSGSMVMSGGSGGSPNYIVIDNGNANAITTDGGTIVSEGEYNQVEWNVGGNTGVYTVPFSYSGNYIPVMLNINTMPGIGNGSIKFSTYHTAALNSSNLPSDVGNVNAFIKPGSPNNGDNSYNIADRFYVIDENTGYSTAPGADNIIFSYVSGGGSTEVGLPNILQQSRLMAQRYNSAANTWSDWFGYAGTDVVSGNTGSVETGPVTSVNMFRSWSLWDQTMPLPVIVSSSNLACNSANTGLAWASVYGGVAPYTYSWAPSGGNRDTAKGLTAGTYTVTVSDNHGITSTVAVTVTQPASVAISITGQMNVSCNGGSNGSVTVSASGGTSPYVYHWSNGGSGVEATGLGAGNYTVVATDNNGCSGSTIVTVTQPGVLVGIGNAVNVQCYNESNGIASVSVSGGTVPYSYLWQGGQTTTSISGLSQGTYSVVITDNGGCMATAGVSITEPVSALGVSASVTGNVLCRGGNSGTASVTASGGTVPYSYRWTGGQTGSNATGLSAGGYTVSVTDNNGCVGTAKVTVTQPNTGLGVSAVVNANEGCNGDSSGEATATATGGTGAYTYMWTGGATVSVASGLGAGTYTVTAMDGNGCTATAKVVILQPPALTATTKVANPLCHGGEGSAQVNVSGGTTPYTYSWTHGGQTTSSVTGLKAGTYIVTVTDGHGCNLAQSVTIIAPPALIGKVTNVEQVLCNGASTGSITVSVTGGSAPFTYQWTPSGGTNNVAAHLSAGTYTVHITDHNGCTLSVSQTINQPATGLGGSIVINNNVLCNGANNGSATFNVSGGAGGYAYFWSNGHGSNQTATGLSAGSFTCRVTDANGCTLTASVTITQPLVLTLSSWGQTNITCAGSNNGTLSPSIGGGTQPYMYSWMPGGQKTQRILNLSAGTYSLQVTDNNGCVLTAKTTITTPAMLRDSIVSSGCAGGSGTATGGVKGGVAPYTYNWAPSGGSGITASGLSNGTYTLTVTDNNECTASASFVSNCHSSEGGGPGNNGEKNKSSCCDLSTLSGVALYPNPNNGEFSIKGLKVGMEIELYNELGQIISKFTAGEEDTMEFNISAQPNGIYLVRIMSEDGSFVVEKKVIKSW